MDKGKGKRGKIKESQAPIPFDSWASYSTFERSVKREGRFIHTSQVDQFLTALKASATGRTAQVSEGEVYWRSQVGHHWKIWRQGESETGEAFEIECPFPPARMKPDPDKTVDNRANPRGIPFLYLADDEQTALSEVRPWKAAKISLAKMAITRDLTVVDCRVPGRKSLFFFEEPSPEKKEQAVWAAVDEAFSRPVSPNDERLDYVPTQIVAELFKQSGFDGLMFRSSLRQGTNLVLFDLDAADVVEVQLHECESVSVRCKPVASPFERRRGPAWPESAKRA